MCTSVLEECYHNDHNFTFGASVKNEQYEARAAFRASANAEEFHRNYIVFQEPTFWDCSSKIMLSDL